MVSSRIINPGINRFMLKVIQLVSSEGKFRLGPPWSYVRPLFHKILVSWIGVVDGEKNVDILTLFSTIILKIFILFIFFSFTISFLGNFKKATNFIDLNHHLWHLVLASQNYMNHVRLVNTLLWGVLKWKCKLFLVVVNVYTNLQNSN